MLDLPGPVATYLAAVKAKDADMLALCFADDARVHDENSDYWGLDAIRAWKQETDAKYRYVMVMEPLDASVSNRPVYSETTKSLKAWRSSLTCHRRESA
jgi:hypothetical protein